MMLTPSLTGCHFTSNLFCFLCFFPSNMFIYLFFFHKYTDYHLYTHRLRSHMFVHTVKHTRTTPMMLSPYLTGCHFTSNLFVLFVIFCYFCYFSLVSSKFVYLFFFFLSQNVAGKAFMEPLDITKPTMWYGAHKIIRAIINQYLIKLMLINILNILSILVYGKRASTRTHN